MLCYQNRVSMPSNSCQTTAQGQEPGMLLGRGACDGGCTDGPISFAYINKHRCGARMRPSRAKGCMPRGCIIHGVVMTMPHGRHRFSTDQIVHSGNLGNSATHSQCKGNLFCSLKFHVLFHISIMCAYI